MLIKEYKKLRKLDKMRDELRIVLRKSVDETKNDIEEYKKNIAEDYTNEKFDYMWEMMVWVDNMEELLKPKHD